ncbi:MAG: glutamate--tRNA ligase [Candidatus Bathyarchaeota archaeon]|nr:MAG: glutamate--tRNA ligase [Candidatus Bathyarchaeota archaeon]
MSFDNQLKNHIERIALLNAHLHNGRARKGSVIGKLFSEQPQLKEKIKQISTLVEEITEKVNALSPQAQRIRLEEVWPEALSQSAKEKPGREEKPLPPLEYVEAYDVITTRFSPNPDAPIHLGSARAIILCKEYADVYDGRFLVRFEDTDPKGKRPQLEFYKAIKKDLNWLNSQPDAYYYQSDRLQIYYEHAEHLLKAGTAYVCTCKPRLFRDVVMQKKPCPCRPLDVNKHLIRWEKMLNGTFGEGEAVVRVKTDLNHPNPAVRDWPALRIIDTEKHPHPRTGNKYRVWPLYNLACGVDDHLMGVSHIIRGKEHLTNQTRQEFMYVHFGWRYPETIHYGRMKIVGASLSKSEILRQIHAGTYKNWDDPRLATFSALRRRGIQPEAIKHLILDVGPKTQDITLSWENLYAHNRRLVEPHADRFFFIDHPVQMTVHGTVKDFTAKVPVHPEYEDRGVRVFTVKETAGITHLSIAARDHEKMVAGQLIRLMELFNIQIQQSSSKGVTAVFHSEEYEKARAVKAPLIHWLPNDVGVKCRVILPDATIAKGLVEPSIRKIEVGRIVQFTRFGFVRIDAKSRKMITAYFCHR